MNKGKKIPQIFPKNSYPQISVFRCELLYFRSESIQSDIVERVFSRIFKSNEYPRSSVISNSIYLAVLRSSWLTIVLTLGSTRRSFYESCTALFQLLEVRGMPIEFGIRSFQTQFASDTYLTILSYFLLVCSESWRIERCGWSGTIVDLLTRAAGMACSVRYTC